MAALPSPRSLTVLRIRGPSRAAVSEYGVRAGPPGAGEEAPREVAALRPEPVEVLPGYVHGHAPVALGDDGAHDRRCRRLREVGSTMRPSTTAPAATP